MRRTSLKVRPLMQLPIRTCYTLHECCLCKGQITNGQQYHDGGYGRRAHVQCQDKAPNKDRQTVLLTGPFTRDDLQVIANAMRLIEQARPEETFDMVLANDEASRAEAEEILKRIYPFVEGTPAEVKIWGK
jgi:hypothetical protein